MWPDAGLVAFSIRLQLVECRTRSHFSRFKRLTSGHVTWQFSPDSAND